MSLCNKESISSTGSAIWRTRFGEMLTVRSSCDDIKRDPQLEAVEPESESIEIDRGLLEFELELFGFVAADCNLMFMLLLLDACTVAAFSLVSCGSAFEVRLCWPWRGGRCEL